MDLDTANTDNSDQGVDAVLDRTPVKVISNPCSGIIVQKISRQGDLGVFHRNVLAYLCFFGIGIVGHEIAPKVHGVVFYAFRIVLNGVYVAESLDVIAIGVLVEAIAEQLHIGMLQMYITNQPVYVGFEIRHGAIRMDDLNDRFVLGGY